MDKPHTFNGELAALPAALRPLTEHKRWVVWKWERTKSGKWTKPPYRADAPNSHALSNEPSTWSTYATALAAFQAGKADGIGYVLTDSDIGAFDLDKCLDPITGAIDAWAKKLIDETDSYVEVTPSGTGLRIIGGAAGEYLDKSFNAPNGGEIELYRRNTRFITVTGLQFGTCTELKTIDDLIDRTFEKFAGSEVPKGRKAPSRRRMSETPIPTSLLKLIEDHCSWGKGISADKNDMPDFEQIVQAINLIPNPDLTWKEWKRIIMAIWAAFLGNEDGLAAAHAWSRKSSKYDLDGTNQAWAEICGSPPTDRGPGFPKIDAGTLIYMADQASPGWRDDPADGTDKGPDPDPADGPDQSAKFVSPIELFWPGETPDPEPDWLIKKRMPKVGIGLLSARRSKGKTFIGLDLGYALSKRSHWTGQRITEKVAMLWIAAESPGQIPLRLHGLPEEPGQWPFVYIKRCPTLLDVRGRVNRSAIPQLVAVWRAANQQMLDRFGVRIGVILIDTMLRVAGYGDRGENDPSQGGAVVSALTDISIETGTFVLGIDHMGKDESRGTRGNTAKEDGSDLVLYISDDALEIEKVRNGPDGISIPFKLEQVELGNDRDGDPVTTCKVEWGEPGAKAKSTGKKLPESTKLLLKAMGDINEWPTPVDNLRMAHKRIYKAENKSVEHERNGWSKATKAYGLRFFDQDGLPMVDEPAF